MIVRNSTPAMLRLPVIFLITKTKRPSSHHCRSRSRFEVCRYWCRCWFCVNLCESVLSCHRRFTSQFSLIIKISWSHCIHSLSRNRFDAITMQVGEGKCSGFQSEIKTKAAKRSVAVGVSTTSKVSTRWSTVKPPAERGWKSGEAKTLASSSKDKPTACRFQFKCKTRIWWQGCK